MKHASHPGAPVAVSQDAAKRFSLCLVAAAAIVASYRASAPEGCDPQNNGLLIGDIPSKRPSLADVLICAANPEETPMVTRMRKGKALRQFDHKYFVEVKPNRKTGGATDGQDVDGYEKGGPRYAVEIRAQEFRRTYGVGQQSQEIVEDTAVPDQMAKLRLDYSKEIIKDIEAKVLSSDVSAEDEGTPDKGSRMGGLGYLLSAPADSMTDKPINTTIRTPANQRYTGTYANFNEAALVDMMEARRNLTGQSAELLAMIGTQIQRKFDTFENYLPDLASHTVTLRNMQNVGQKREIQRGVRFYSGSFGYLELMINDFLPSQKRAYILDMTQLSMLPMGKGAEKKPLPDMGGGPRELLKMTFAYKPTDVRAHIFIKPSDE